MRIFISLLLILSFVNPYIETLEYKDPVPLMFAHYSLFAAGMLMGSFFNIRRRCIFLPMALAIFWHIPLPFSLSASLLSYRLLSEATLFIAGAIAGGTMNKFTWKEKGIMIALWFLADNTLSVIFVLYPQFYSHSMLPISPYQPAQFAILGFLMILLMNMIIGFLVWIYARTFAQYQKAA